MNNVEQQFLNELDDKLWKSAERLRNALDAANYKHVVLGIIFLKYVSDAFEERQQELGVLLVANGTGFWVLYLTALRQNPTSRIAMASIRNVWSY